MKAARCGKRCFDEYSARAALVDAKIRRALHNAAKRKEERVYECNICEGGGIWHLTSSPLREVRQR